MKFQDPYGILALSATLSPNQVSLVSWTNNTNARKHYDIDPVFYNAFLNQDEPQDFISENLLEAILSKTEKPHQNQIV